MASSIPPADPWIRGLFPRLATGDHFELTSPWDHRYNCIAHAAGDSDHWWEPPGDMLRGVYWPPEAPAERTVQAYVQAFMTEGYTLTLSSELEPGKEKIAIFASAGVATHAARQLSDGTWTSKLGKGYDISHDRVEDVGGSVYGEVTVFLERAAI